MEKDIAKPPAGGGAISFFLKPIQIPIKEDCVFERSCVRIELFRAR